MVVSISLEPLPEVPVRVFGDEGNEYPCRVDDGDAEFRGMVEKLGLIRTSMRKDTLTAINNDGDKDRVSNSTTQLKEAITKMEEAATDLLIAFDVVHTIRQDAAFIEHDSLSMDLPDYLIVPITNFSREVAVGVKRQSFQAAAQSMAQWCLGTRREMIRGRRLLSTVVRLRRSCCLAPDVAAGHSLESSGKAPISSLGRPIAVTDGICIIVDESGAAQDADKRWRRYRPNTVPRSAIRDGPVLFFSLTHIGTGVSARLGLPSGASSAHAGQPFVSLSVAVAELEAEALLRAVMQVLTDQASRALSGAMSSVGMPSWAVQLVSDWEVRLCVDADHVLTVSWGDKAIHHGASQKPPMRRKPGSLLESLCRLAAVTAMAACASMECDNKLLPRISNLVAHHIYADAVASAVAKAVKSFHSRHHHRAPFRMTWLRKEEDSDSACLGLFSESVGATVKIEIDGRGPCRVVYAWNRVGQTAMLQDSSDVTALIGRLLDAIGNKTR